MKQVQLIKADGTVTVLEKVPGIKKIQELIGGYFEHVRVLDREEKGQRIYTSMFVHETGLIDGQPRNEKATEIYQRNIRTAFPRSSHPFREAEKEWLGGLPADTVVIDGNPPGFDKDDPPICGDVVFFSGYNCEEADDAICKAS